MTPEQREAIQTLANVTGTLIECVGELAKLVALETENMEAVEMVIAKLEAFNLTEERT